MFIYHVLYVDIMRWAHLADLHSDPRLLDDPIMILLLVFQLVHIELLHPMKTPSPYFLSDLLSFNDLLVALDILVCYLVDCLAFRAFYECFIWSLLFIKLDLPLFNLGYACQIEHTMRAVRMVTGKWHHIGSPPEAVITIGNWILALHLSQVSQLYFILPNRIVHIFLSLFQVDVYLDCFL